MFKWIIVLFIVWAVGYGCFKLGYNQCLMEHSGLIAAHQWDDLPDPDAPFCEVGFASGQKVEYRGVCLDKSKLPIFYTEEDKKNWELKGSECNGEKVGKKS